MICEEEEKSKAKGLQMCRAARTIPGRLVGRRGAGMQPLPGLAGTPPLTSASRSRHFNVVGSLSQLLSLPARSHTLYWFG